MSEAESSELDRDVDASMRLFQKSQVGDAAVLVPIKPARVLLVLDGSPQDETGIEAVGYLRETFNTETLILDGREVPDGEVPGGEVPGGEVPDGEVSDGEVSDGETATDIRTGIIERVSGSRPIDRGEGDSYDAILSALATHDVDLVVLPCPFGREFEKVGTDSAGTVIDVLLSRCPCPMLVIRRDDQNLRECVQTLAVVVGAECDVESKAAAWAFGLAAENATVTLNLVVEKEQFENIRSIVEALTPETKLDTDSFAAALTKTHQTLHNAMAKTATQFGKSYHLRPQAGQVAPPNPLQNNDKTVLVLPLEVDDRFGQGFVQDRIRRSPHPVLVVPSHVVQ